MRVITAIEIATNYPDNILINASQNKGSGKWSSFMYMTRDGDIHKLMLSFDNAPFDSEQEAIDKMREVADSGIKYYEENYGNKK